MVSKSRWRLLISVGLVAVLAVLGIASAASAATYATPTGLKVTAHSSSTVDLAWTAVRNAPRYRIQMATSSSMSGAVYFRVTPNQRQMTGLKANTRYYFKVRVITADGGNLSAYSSAVSTTTDAFATPTGLKTTAHTTSTVDLAWNAVNGAPQYRIQMATNSAMSGSTYVRVTATNRVMTGLARNTKYYFKVRVITADGGNLSAYSSAVSTTTDAFATPTGLKSTAHTTDTASLVWNAVNGAPQYRIQMATNSAMSGSTYVRVTATNRVMTGLARNTKYYFKVRVITSDGRNLSPYSAAISVTTDATAPGEFTLTAPTGLASTDQASRMLSLKWNAVAGAPRYRIQLSTNPEMSGATYFRFTDTRSQIAGLTAGTKYFVKVRVISDDGVNLSEYSGAINATTRAASEPESVAPFDLRATRKTTSEIDLTWRVVAGAPKYEVQRSETADMAKSVPLIVTLAEAKIADLSANTKYYVRVRAATDTGTALGNFTPALSVTTNASTTPQPLKIGSFNVKCANCDSHLLDEGTWVERRPTVVSTIMGQSPDVIGFQEAAQSWLKDSSGKAIDLSQFEDLRNGLKTAGGNYQLANANRNNCVKSTTPTNCVYKDQGASKGTKVFYNANTVELLGQGSKKLESACDTCNERYVAWATLRQKSTGKKFFFATIHIEPTATYAAMRIIQTQQVVNEIALKNTAKLPVIAVGDFNSTRYQVPTNEPYDKMVASGLVDPLGQTYKSATISSLATAENRIFANYNSFNNFKRAQTFYGSNENGSNLDYIFTSPMRVTEWETVVRLDSDGKLTGPIPSDHNMLRTTLLLP